MYVKKISIVFTIYRSKYHLSACRVREFLLTSLHKTNHIKLS